MNEFLKRNSDKRIRSINQKSKKMNYTERIEYNTNCSAISVFEWDKLMEGAKKADGKKIRAMIKKQLPEIYESLSLYFHNPYENQSKKTERHYIYVHSAIEYFFKKI